MHTCIKKNIFFLKSLVEKNPDFNIINKDGNTALIIASEYNYLNKIKILIKYKYYKQGR